MSDEQRDQCSPDTADPYCLDAIGPAEMGLEPVAEEDE